MECGRKSGEGCLRERRVGWVEGCGRREGARAENESEVTDAYFSLEIYRLSLSGNEITSVQF